MVLAHVLVALSAAAAAVAAPTVALQERQACPGYRPVKEVFSVGISQQYIMDVNDRVANPSSWDWNTTKIYYAQQCDLDVDATHELSFVNLEDCSPVTTRFKRVDSMDRNEVRAYGEFLGPTIPVKSDAKAVARFPCYPSRSTLSSYTYEVHFEGLHRSEMLASLGFYDKVVT